MGVQDSGPVKYSGQMRQEKKCGLGRMTWPNGSTFDGYWLDDTPIGVGVFKFNPGSGAEEVSYESFWQHDR